MSVGPFNMPESLEELEEQRRRQDRPRRASAKDDKLGLPITTQVGSGHQKVRKHNPHDRHAVTVRLADVEPEEVAWLWPPYVPLGKLTLLEGDPGLGKTWLALQLAASITRGHPLPGQDGAPHGAQGARTVVYMSAEDGLADTLRPRLDVMGADPAQVIALTGWRSTDENGDEIEGAVTLGDMPVLREALVEHAPALVVVDPLQAYLGAGVDMHRANETRPILAALAGLAAERNCAVIAIRHLSKASQGRAIYRGLGSIDFAAAARSILLVAEDPEDDRKRIVAHAKSSLAEQGRSLGFELRDSAFYWTGASDITAEQLLAPRQPAEEKDALSEAEDFLAEELSGYPQAASDLRAAAKEAGLAWRTVERAKSKLGITVSREGIPGRRGGGRWLWRLPTHTRGGLNGHNGNPVPDDKGIRPSTDTRSGVNEHRPGRDKPIENYTASTTSRDNPPSYTGEDADLALAMLEASQEQS